MAPREEEGPGEGALELCAEEGGIDEAPPRRRERPEGAVDILGRLGRFSGGGGGPGQEARRSATDTRIIKFIFRTPGPV